MSTNKRRSKRNRTNERILPDPDSFWREDEELAKRAPIQTVDDPTATLRSIGAPPIPGGEEAYNEFLKTVIRASSLVSVLAESVDIADHRPGD